MEFRKLIEENMDSLVADLQGCIQIPSLYRADDSGYPYGKSVQECLEYMLHKAETMGFRTGNMDNHVGWCEYGEGEEMVAVLGHLDVVPEGDGKTMELKLNYRYPVTKTFQMCGPVVLSAMEEAGFTKTAGVYKDKLYMSADSPLVQKLLKVYRECTGDMSEPKAIGGGTYAKMIPNVLAFGPIFPGDEVREHKPDEFMELTRLLDNGEILAKAMYAMATD